MILISNKRLKDIEILWDNYSSSKLTLVNGINQLQATTLYKLWTYIRYNLYKRDKILAYMTYCHLNILFGIYFLFN